MKKILIVLMGMLCATALVANARDASKPKKAKLTAEQQAVQKDMLDKYDTNKDGKLDKNERAAMSKEDKDKMTKAGLSKTAKKGAATKPTTDSSTNPPTQ